MHDVTVNLHARFSDTSYRVTFYDEDGKVISIKDVHEGGKADASGVYVKAAPDETITGWTTTKNGTDKFDFNTTITSDTSLYPLLKYGKWAYFNTNGGSQTAPEHFTAGSTVKKPKDPSKTGYSFAGWYTDYALNNKWNTESTYDNNVTFYAAWTEAKTAPYTIAYFEQDANDDYYTFVNSDTEYGNVGEMTQVSAYTAPQSFNDVQKKELKGFHVLDITQQTINRDGSTVVNVKYDRNVYTIKFFSTAVYNGPEFENLRINARYGAYIGDKWPEVPSFTYDYHSHGSKEWRIDCNMPVRTQSSIEVMPFGGAMYYAYDAKQWYDNDKSMFLIQRFREVLDGEKGERTRDGKRYGDCTTDTVYRKGYPLDLPNEDRYAIPGFSFVYDINDNIQMGNSGYLVAYYYTRNSYTITYCDSLSETVFKRVEKKYGVDILDATSYTPTKTGYTFVGWYDNDKCIGDAVDVETRYGKTMPDYGVTLYAKWNNNGSESGKAASFNVDFDLNGATGSIASQRIEEDDYVVKPVDPTKEGYRFNGWTLNGNSFEFQTPVTDNIVLKADWLKTGTGYTLTYYVGANAVNASGAATQYMEGVKTAVSAAPSIDSGKTFLGWYIADAPDHIYYPGQTYTVSASDADNNVIKFIAKLGDKKSTASLGYNSNYPEGADLSQQHTIVNKLVNNSVQTLYSATVAGFTIPDGCTFAGWNTQADGKGTTY